MVLRYLGNQFQSVIITSASFNITHAGYNNANYIKYRWWFDKNGDDSTSRPIVFINPRGAAVGYYMNLPNLSAYNAPAEADEYILRGQENSIAGRVENLKVNSAQVAPAVADVAAMLEIRYFYDDNLA